MADQIKVEGLEELKDALTRQLPEALQGKALQGALKKAAALIVASARTRAPVDTGRLRRAIYSFRDRDSRKGHEARLISVRSGKRLKKSNRDAYYWKFVEFGHRVAKRGAGGGERYRAASHGGKLKGSQAGDASGKVVPPRPFLRPAFEAEKLRALDVFQKELQGEVLKVARRAAQRSQSRLGRKLRRSVTGF